MKKLGFWSMLAATMLMCACSNVGNEPGDGGNNNEGGGNNDEPTFVEPAGEGTEESPYNVSKALLEQDGSNAWVKGYIVGQVAGADITADSQFDAPFTGAVYDDGSVATIGTNILIAAKANENNHSACLVVQLPKGAIREALELLGNPTNDGKEVELYGQLTKYFGVAGMKSTSKAKFDGTSIGEGGNEGGGTTTDPIEGEGKGTKEEPYNAAAVTSLNNMTKENGPKAWVKAYIVGQINGKSVSDVELEAPFNIPDGSSKGTNLVIADDANATSGFVAVQLPAGAVRDGLNLPEHPEMDGKEVLLYGELLAYFSSPGIKNVSCAIVDGTVYGSEPVEVETPEGSVVFEESFATSLGNFTADDRLLGEGLSYVWNYDSRYTCAKASAYNKQAYDSESWLVSPAIALNGKAATLSFEHAANYINNAKEEMRLFYSTNDGADWTELTIPVYASSWTFVNAGNIALPAADSIKIAFAYKSTSAGACTWEIKNVKIYQ